MTGILLRPGLAFKWVTVRNEIPLASSQPPVIHRIGGWVLYKLAKIVWNLERCHHYAAVLQTRTVQFTKPLHPEYSWTEWALLLSGKVLHKDPLDASSASSRFFRNTAVSCLLKPSQNPAVYFVPHLFASPDNFNSLSFFFKSLTDNLSTVQHSWQRVHRPVIPSW